MILYDADVAGPNPFTVRLFAHERRGLRFEAEAIALSTLENRGRKFREEVNPRGELPALRVGDGGILTEITAICEYLDEIAEGGTSLVGDNPEARARVRSWARWLDLEICQPVVNWWRGSGEAEDFYRGHRVIFRNGRPEFRLQAERALNFLDDYLEDKNWIGPAERPMLSDILLFGFLFPMAGTGAWINHPGRVHIARWFAAMTARPSCSAAQQSFVGTIAL